MTAPAGSEPPDELTEAQVDRIADVVVAKLDDRIRARNLQAFKDELAAIARDAARLGVHGPTTEGRTNPHRLDAP